MTKTEYMEEIQLIRDQNDTEFELYPLVSDIIAPTLKGLSKRYVFARRITPLGQIYFGISSFPDIAILDRDFKNERDKDINICNWKKLMGCIEAKALGKKLYSLKELLEDIKNPGKGIQDEVAQLLGEILWYKKVLYTNGLQWKLFSLGSCDKFGEVVVNVGKERKRFGENDKTPFEWWKKTEVLDIINNSISEQVITEDCTKEWNTFTENIKKNWRA